MDLPVVNAIWIGKTMGPVHAACLKSFVVTGHQVFLHAYGEVSDAPAGVWYADANLLRPEDQLLRYPNGSYAISANLMRYELLRQEMGLYVDCDVFCLKPIQDADTIFGQEDDYYFNTAVMKLPATSPVLADLCSIKEGWIPPWATHLLNQPAKPLTELVWGTTGPRAFTHYARQHGITAMAEPCDVFYPLYPGRTKSFYDPGLSLEDVTTARTRYVHLYHATSGRPLEEIPETSPLGRMLKLVGAK